MTGAVHCLRICDENDRRQTRTVQSDRRKPGFNEHEENGVSAFEDITESSFPGKWKVIYFYPKDFTFVCPTEIVGFNNLASEFISRDAILMGGSVDNEYVTAWRRRTIRAG